MGRGAGVLVLECLYGCNHLADNGDFGGVTRVVNGGAVDMEDRIKRSTLRSARSVRRPSTRRPDLSIPRRADQHRATNGGTCAQHHAGRRGRQQRARINRRQHAGAFSLRLAPSPPLRSGRQQTPLCRRPGRHPALLVGQAGARAGEAHRQAQRSYSRWPAPWCRPHSARHRFDDPVDAVSAPGAARKPWQRSRPGAVDIARPFAPVLERLEAMAARRGKTPSALRQTPLAQHRRPAAARHALACCDSSMFFRSRSPVSLVCHSNWQGLTAEPKGHGHHA